MTLEDKASFETGSEPPPPMDEAWWASVLSEDPRQAVAEELSHERPISPGSSQPGSIEDWLWARELFEADDTVDLTVIGSNRGGLLVAARSLRGFVPVSHLVSVDQASNPSFSADQLADLVGKELCLKVIEFDPQRGRLVLSERAAQAGPGKRIELLESLKTGDRCHGKVTNITRFGVFVDLGGVEGLIHVSELSWGRVRHPEDVVTCGDELEVLVLSVDQGQGRIALSLKQLLPDPWSSVEERFEVGQVVEGIVTNVVKFGAFVGLEEGLEGLIHVSELGDGSFLHPRSVIQEGEHVKVKILHIDSGGRRLGLSLRHVGQPGTAKETGEAKEPAEREALSPF